MPAGRPPDYRPEFCEIAIKELKEGASIEEIGLALDCGYSTVYRWMDEHEEFREAIKKGREYSKGWWYKEGRKSMREKDFNSTLWYMNMKNRHGWSDKQEHEVKASVKDATHNESYRSSENEYKKSV